MAKKKRTKLTEWLGDRLRYACGSLSKDARIGITIFMVISLSGLSIYFTISSIYRVGKGNGEKMQIQPIERLELELRQNQSQLDSINQINDFNYEYREFESE